MRNLKLLIALTAIVLICFNATAVIQGKNYAKISIDRNGNVSNVELVRQIDRDFYVQDNDTLLIYKF